MERDVGAKAGIGLIIKKQGDEMSKNDASKKPINTETYPLPISSDLDRKSPRLVASVLVITIAPQYQAVLFLLRDRSLARKIIAAKQLRGIKPPKSEV